MSMPVRNAAGSGFGMLLYKELLRFWKVAAQTITAPVLTALLYLLIFSHVLEAHVQVYENVRYAAFLAPGLIMMSMLQNSFANSSSSLIQSKVSGNLVFVLLPPISHLEFFGAYVIAAVVRGLCVGIGVLGVTMFFAVPPFVSVAWILVFALVGCALMGAIGLLAAILAEKFDHIAAFQNFFIMPATFLSGVFYSIHSLPPVWQKVSHFNPFFFMIDGFRHGFFGQSDVSPWYSFAVVGGCFLLVSGGLLLMLERGYKLRH